MSHVPYHISSIFIYTHTDLQDMRYVPIHGTPACIRLNMETIVYMLVACGIAQANMETMTAEFAMYWQETPSVETGVLLAVFWYGFWYGTMVRLLVRWLVRYGRLVRFLGQWQVRLVQVLVKLAHIIIHTSYIIQGLGNALCGAQDSHVCSSRSGARCSSPRSTSWSRPFSRRIVPTVRSSRRTLPGSRCRANGFRECLGPNI